MSELKKILLNKVCVLNAKTLNKDHNFTNIEYLDTSSITNNQINSTQKLSLEEAPSRAQRMVKNNTIVYSTVRPNLKHFGILKFPPENFIVSTGFITIDIVDRGICPKYLFYSLTRKEVTDRLCQIAATNVSAYPSINPSDLGDIELIIPKDIEAQQKIASVLSSLDAKIELNNRIISELEAMAKQLYDYWFEQFDFPNAEGKPYRSSGGKMVYNEKLKREIPEGWEVKKIKNVAIHITESINSFEFPEKVFKHFSIPAFDSTQQGYSIEKGSTIMSNKFIINDRDLLVSKLNPWFNRVLYTQNFEDQICSTEFVVMRCKTGLKEFLYNTVRTEHFIEYCKLRASGTSNSHKRVDPDVMMNYIFPFENAVITEFSKINYPMIHQILGLKKQNEHYVSLRDWLLPMLMNGQVKVK